MIRVRSTAAVVILMLSLAGCAGDASEVPASTGSPEGETPAAKEEVTWQEAKARTQAMELEMAYSVPEDKVAKVDQLPTGVLIDCSDSLVNWRGATTVTLAEGTDPEPLVREFEEKYRDSRFTIEARTAPAGHYEVGLASPETAEIYLIAPGWDPNTIRIASSSECFTWVDEGKYKRGKF